MIFSLRVEWSFVEKKSVLNDPLTQMDTFDIYIFLIFRGEYSIATNLCMW